MSKKRDKKYIPQQRFNPAYLSQQINILTDNVNHQRQCIDMISLSYDRHVEHLASFARHEIGNAIQSLYAALELHKDDMSAEAYQELKLSADSVHSNLVNFESTVPYSSNNSFTMPKLMVAIETLSRSLLNKHHIKSTYLYDRNDKHDITQPFQQLLQMLHNMVLNSINAMENVEHYERRLVIEAVVDSTLCYISVKDNGCGITDDVIQKVFNYKFTTTPGGSGIGLFHAKNVVDTIGGNIGIMRNLDGFNTVFTIKFPINGNKENTNN